MRISQVKRLRAFLVLFAVVLMAMMTGCAKIPTSSSVHTLEAQAPNRSNDVKFRLSGPKQGDSPTDIVDGFLQANKGVQDNLSHAREFLSAEAKGRWKPESKTVVFGSFPKVVPSKMKDTYELQYLPVAEIDEGGNRKDLLNARPQMSRVTLVKEKGQWRINSVPDMLLISSNDATTLLEQRNLYFYSPDYSRAVADTRWFLKSPSIATKVTSALLRGPSAYLQRAVRSSFDEGATLANSSVAVVDKTALVEISRDYWNKTKTLQRQRINQQLQFSLRGVEGIEKVEIRTDSRPVGDLGAPADGFIPVVMNPPVDASQIGIQDNRLVSFKDRNVTEYSDVQDLKQYAPRAPAISYTKKQFSFLNASGSQLLSTGPGREVVLSQEGPALTAPSFDTQNWVWTAVSGGSGGVRAIGPGGASGSGVDVAAPWLKGYKVKDLRIARDGVRVAVAAEKDGKDYLFFSAIRRSEEGVPLSLNTPVTVPTSTMKFNTVRWLSDSRVVLANLGLKYEVQPTVVSLGGIQEVLGILDGAISLSVGNSNDEIFLVKEGLVYSRVGNAWYENKIKMDALDFIG